MFANTIFSTTHSPRKTLAPRTNMLTSPGPSLPQSGRPVKEFRAILYKAPRARHGVVRALRALYTGSQSAFVGHAFSPGTSLPSVFRPF